MRIAVHDYAGHPFQVELSRSLAERGHAVLHLHSPDYVSGKGLLQRRGNDPATLEVDSVSLGLRHERRSFVRRVRRELLYGRMLARRIGAFAPDVVLSSNTPLLSQRVLIQSCRRARVPFVFWQQDIYSLGMQEAARARLGALGGWLGRAFVAIERRLLQQSAQVVVIADDFLPVLRSWSVDLERVHVIENWAPLGEMPLRPRENSWARRHGLVGKKVVLYAGTIGRKHNPLLLVELARRLRADPEAVLVIVSEGDGADRVARQIRTEALDNVKLLGFQPYADLPDVLASCEVAVVVLEENAGVFSVPSKVLTYHCAGRAIVAAVPRHNLAGRTIMRAGSGLIVSPNDPAAFAEAASLLLRDDARRCRHQESARAYGESAFEIGPITDRFEGVLGLAATERHRERGGLGHGATLSEMIGS